MNSAIEWTDHSWNPWRGCCKVSAGCKNCYMFRDQRRYGNDPTRVVRAADATFHSPLRWREPALVFTCSWSDFFIEDADAWRAEAWEIIRQTPHLTYQVLTKRPENIIDRLPSEWPLPNVWLGVSAENQKTADERLPVLLQIPAALRFVSYEPALGVVKWDDWESIDFLIMGGESGNRARPIDLQWFYDSIAWARINGVKPFVKQLGTHWAKSVGAANSKGNDISEWPIGLRVREIPSAHLNNN